MAIQNFIVLVLTLLLDNLHQTSAGENEHHPLTLDDMQHNQQNDMLQEMLRVVHDSSDFSYEEDSRLRRIIGKDNFEKFKGGVGRRRASRLRTAVGNRRARSQALRREKLKSQGLQSHLAYTSNISRIMYDSDAVE